MSMRSRAATIGSMMLAAARRRHRGSRRAGGDAPRRLSADLGADLDPLGLDLSQQLLDPTGIDQAGAEMLRRLSAAGDPETQALDRRAPAVPRRHVAGDE